jgi:triphosphoribosyl-dephospho-CoA synthase
MAEGGPCSQENVPEESVRDAIEQACLRELEALKPGNVHVHAEGHGMTVDDFKASATIAAVYLSRRSLSVGEKILRAVEDSVASVGCNTNLGIVLLCAPLAQAALAEGEGTLRQRLDRVLRSLSVDDARAVYKAIRIASPAGLGASPEHDVAHEPTVDLREAMAAAAGRDRIAFQYAHDFEDVFGLGVASWREALSVEIPGGMDEAEAAARVYLGFLGGFPDSHIERKYSAAVAQDVRGRAMKLEATLATLASAEEKKAEMLEFDAELKERNLNPGTSADLTVASLLAAKLEDILTRPIST